MALKENLKTVATHGIVAYAAHYITKLREERKFRKGFLITSAVATSILVGSFKIVPAVVTYFDRQQVYDHELEMEKLRRQQVKDSLNAYYHVASADDIQNVMNRQDSINAGLQNTNAGLQNTQQYISSLDERINDVSAKASVLSGKMNNVASGQTEIAQKVNNIDKGLDGLMQYASRQNNAPSHTAPSDVYQGDVQSDEGSNSGFSYTIEINQAAHTLRLYDGSNKILFETGDISLPVSNRLKTGDFKMYEARQRNDAYAPGSIKYDPENPQVIITGAGPNNEYGADVQSHRNVTRTGLRTRNDVMQKILGYVQNSDNTLVKVR